MDRNRVQEIVYRAIDKINEGLPPEQQLTKSPDTCLFGDQGSLDSFGLINLIVALERTLCDETGTFIALAQERARSTSSPFTTIGSLIDHIDTLWKENAGG